GSTIATQPSIERGTVGMLPPLGYFRFGPRDRIVDASPSEFLGSRRNFALNDRHPLFLLHHGPIFRLRLQNLYCLTNVAQGERTRCGVALNRSPYFCNRSRDISVSDVREQVPAELHDTPRRLSLSTDPVGLPAAAMTAPTFSVAARSGSWKRCA